MIRPSLLIDVYTEIILTCWPLRQKLPFFYMYTEAEEYSFRLVIRGCWKLEWKRYDILMTATTVTMSSLTLFLLGPVSVTCRSNLLLLIVLCGVIVMYFVVGDSTVKLVVSSTKLNSTWSSLDDSSFLLLLQNYDHPNSVLYLRQSYWK